MDVGNQVSASDTNGIAVVTKMSPIDVEFAIPQDNAAWLQHNAGAFMEVRAFDRPVLPPLVRAQQERSLACPDEDPYAAHLRTSVDRLSWPAVVAA